MRIITSCNPLPAAAVEEGIELASQLKTDARQQVQQVVLYNMLHHSWQGFLQGACLLQLVSCN
jgi:hypothetical protein